VKQRASQRLPVTCPAMSALSMLQSDLAKLLTEPKPVKVSWCLRICGLAGSSRPTLCSDLFINCIVGMCCMMVPDCIAVDCLLLLKCILFASSRDRERSQKRIRDRPRTASAGCDLRQLGGFCLKQRGREHPHAAHYFVATDMVTFLRHCSMTTPQPTPPQDSFSTFC